jgi:hypothetical protein
MKRALCLFFCLGLIWETPARAGSASVTALPSADLVWRPASSEFTRFEVILPRAGIEEALRHDDGSTLYYLASVRDNGIKLLPKPQPTYALSWAPEGLEAFARFSVAPNYFVTVGASTSGSAPAPLAELEYVTSPDPWSVSIVTAGFTGGPSIGYGRTKLNSDETFETYWSLSFEAHGGTISAGYGATWFSCFAEIDCAAGADWAGEEITAGIELRRDFDDFTGVVRVTMPNNERPTVAIGLTRHFGNSSAKISSSNHRLDILDSVSLKGLRYRGIPAAWQRDISLSGIRGALSSLPDRE